MITKITGKLVHLGEEAATLEVGAFEYEVYIPEFVRRQMQASIGQSVSLKTMEFIEGNPQRGRLVPRLIGFMNEAEREFFELVCSVDGVGVKKALRAMVRPVNEVATSIEEQDVKQLTTLPGIGPAVADRIVAKLRRKMPKFALMVARQLPADGATAHDVVNDTYEALISLGHSAGAARKRIEAATADGKKFKSADELLAEIYRHERNAD